MSETAFTRLCLLALLLCCAGLLYLDVIRSRDIEGLHMRLDRLSPPPAKFPRVGSSQTDAGDDRVAAADVPPGSGAAPVGDSPPAPPAVHPLEAAVIQHRQPPHQAPTISDFLGADTDSELSPGGDQ